MKNAVMSDISPREFRPQYFAWRKIIIIILIYYYNILLLLYYFSSDAKKAYGQNAQGRNVGGGWGE